MDPIDAAYRHWLTAGRLGKQSGGLSPTTVLQHHHILNHALKSALKKGKIQYNPASLATIPKAKVRKEVAYLSEAQCNRLLAAAAAQENKPLHPAILLMLNCAFRRGETFALHWSDVDLEKGRIVVRYSVVKTRANGIALKTPKNGRTRALPIGPELIAALRAHKVEQNKWRLSCGEAYKDNDLIFARADGGLMDPDWLTSAFRSLARKVKFPDMGPHALRHTSATLMLSKGVPMKVASERLGHSGVAITMDLYSHVTPTMQDDAAQTMDRLVAGMTSHQNVTK